MYRGYFITVEKDSNGRSEWVAYSRGSLVACERSKERLFEVVDAMLK